MALSVVHEALEMKKNLFVLLLSAVTLVLVVLCTIQYLQIRELDSAPADEPETEQTDAGRTEPLMTKEEKSLYRDAISELESQLAEVHQTAVETTNEPPQGADSPQPTETESPLAGLAEMIQNPAMKEMIRAQQRATLSISHGALFDYLELSDEELAELKDLLVEKQMALVDISFEMMNSSASLAERAEKAEQISQLTDDYESRIEQLLGEADYAVYKEYEETQPERMQLNLFKQSLGATDQLDDQQEHDLIRAMHEERTAFRFSTNYDDQAATSPTMFSEDVVAKHMEELGLLQAKYVARAEKILTTAQLEQFRTNQEQQQAMQEMAMKMASQMFGTSSQPETDADPAPGKGEKDANE